MSPKTQLIRNASRINLLSTHLEKKAHIILTAVIATLITTVVFFALPKFQKYRAKIISTEFYSIEIEIFNDLNGDNTSERIRLFPDFLGASAVILEQNDKMLYQHNFSGTFTSSNYYYINDYNNDLLKELYLFTTRNDSLFMHIIEGITGKVVAENIFLTTFRYRQSHPDINISDCEMHDFDGDGILDLYININCSFTYRNRKYITYNIAKQKITNSKPTGISLTDDVQLFDINEDGNPEIFGNYKAYGNSPSNYFLSDTFMWLLTPTINSGMLFPPQKKGFYPGQIITKPLTSKEGNRIAYYQCHMGVNIDSTHIAVVSHTGSEFKRVNFLYNHFMRDAYFNTIPENNPNEIVLFTKDGQVKYFDSQLNKIKDSKSFTFSRYILAIDIDNDTYKELIFTDSNHNLILSRNNLLHPVYLPIKCASSPYISVDYTQQGNPILNIQAGKTLYKVNYYKSYYYIFRYLIFAFIWIISFLTFHFLGKVYKKIASRRYETERQMAALQLTVIENQLNPHFNLNILNSIGSLYETQEKEKAQYYFGKYSKLLRQSLFQSGQIAIPIADEIEFTMHYLELEKLRMNNRFNFKVEGFEDIPEIDVPKMLIHTFCENAIKHGLKHVDQDGLLIIQFRQGIEFIRIIISDNGIGRKKAKQYSTMSTNRGIDIVNQTLKLYFELKNKRITYKITDLYTDTDDPKGTKVDITIPV